MVRGSLYLVSLEAAMWVLDGDGTGVISEHLGTIVNYVHLFWFVLCIGPDVPVTAWLCKCAHCMLSGN